MLYKVFSKSIHTLDADLPFVGACSCALIIIDDNLKHILLDLQEDIEVE